MAHEELIPYLEDEFRIIGEPWARVLAGRSTGGWEAAAMMIFYPDLFAGSWPWAPDPIDFRKLMQINIYDDDNAYYNEHEWIRTGRPAQREIDGLVNYMVQDEYRYEQVVGPKDRSGGQWAVWQAVYSSLGSDGYPEPLWDPETGQITRPAVYRADEGRVILPIRFEPAGSVFVVFRYQLLQRSHTLPSALALQSSVQCSTASGRGSTCSRPRSRIFDSRPAMYLDCSSQSRVTLVTGFRLCGPIIM